MITAGFAGPVAAAQEIVVGSPNITASAADVQFRASESATLSVTVNNDGQLTEGGRDEYENEVQTAQSVRIDIAEDQIDAPIEVNTGTQTLGSLNDGQSETVDFALEIGRATPGTLKLRTVTHERLRMGNLRIPIGKTVSEPSQRRLQFASKIALNSTCVQLKRML